jgi:dTDP-4-amino-4,6-dideoxy-D-galactose acyltransferase
MYLLTNATDGSAIQLASEWGWRLVDPRITLEGQVSTIAKSSRGVRPATEDDITQLRELASRSHRDSRFYADGNFSKHACNRLFAKWIERSVRDRDFAGTVLVAESSPGSPAGYITCTMREGVGQIGLIAVDEKARGAGLGASLVAESANWFRAQGAERVSVVTQAQNVAALRMYHRCGFSIKSVELWFHWWRTEAGNRGKPARR